MKVAVAFDHRVSSCAKPYSSRRASRCEAIDLGVKTRAFASTTRPGSDVGKRIRAAQAERGILVCGSGVGACVAACKIPGIRAAICHDATRLIRASSTTT